MRAETVDRAALALWGATTILMCVAIYLVFLYAPDERVMGAVQRVFYFHVPVAMMAFLSVFVLLVGSAGYLWTREPRWDHLARAATEAAPRVAALMATLSRAASVLPPICGVMTIVGIDRKGWSADRGSSAKVSRPAPARCPAVTDCASAISSINPPRAVLIRMAPFFMAASWGAAIILRVSGVRGQCSDTRSLRSRSSPSVSTQVTL